MGCLSARSIDRVAISRDSVAPSSGASLSPCSSPPRGPAGGGSLRSSPPLARPGGGPAVRWSGPTWVTNAGVSGTKPIGAGLWLTRSVSLACPRNSHPDGARITMMISFSRFAASPFRHPPKGGHEGSGGGGLEPDVNRRSGEGVAPLTRGSVPAALPSGLFPVGYAAGYHHDAGSVNHHHAVTAVVAAAMGCDATSTGPGSVVFLPFSKGGNSAQL